MKAAPFFKVLETRSCEVYRAKIAKVGNKNHMPDFFILFFYASLLCCAILPDAIVLYTLFIGKNLPLFIIFILSIVVRIILEVYMEEKSPHDYVPEGIRTAKIQLLFYICGAGSLVVCRKILLETYSSQKPTIKRSTIIHNLSFRIFHVSKENIHYIKMFFFLNTALKSLPQLMVLPIVVLEYSHEYETRIAAMISILVNISVFSATVSLIFPVRDTPTVYRTHTCVVFEAVSKFYAAVCACCIYILVFVVVYAKINYYAASVYIFKFLIWIWPCWRCVRPQQLRKLYFGIYLLLITFISSIFYLHPFKGRGTLFYYPFYLIHFLFELAFMYLTTDTDFVVLSFYFTLQALLLSFLAAYALVNVIHKKDADTVLRSSITSDRQETEGTGEAEVWHWREHI